MHFNALLIYNIYYVAGQVAETLFLTPCKQLYIRALSGVWRWLNWWLTKKFTNAPFERSQYNIRI